jgi:hypothetical protein
MAVLFAAAALTPAQAGVVVGTTDTNTTNTVTSSRRYTGPNGLAGDLRTGLITASMTRWRCPSLRAWLS